METKTKNDVKAWTLDAAHSTVHFSVKHMIISHAKGAFNDYKITAETNGLDFEDAKIELEIDVKSINTNMADRDNHLRSVDFFDVEKYPTIKFISKSMQKINDEEYKLIGNITVKDITRPIEFKVNYGGQVIDPWGNIRTGFGLEGAIDRFDFGLTWNALIETGGAMVGKNVKLEASIEMVSPK
jgi:polyisoprenoid-binding protein YceI